MAFYRGNNTDIKFTESTFRIMIVICYTEIDRVWDESTFGCRLSQLLPIQRERILAYKNRHEQQLRLQGRLLIPEVLSRLGIADFSFADLKWSDSNKPYVDTGADFNIAHSGNIVVCAGMRNGRIGIDIEQIKDININDVREQFQGDEWQIIQQSQQPLQEIYTLWTRKEAVLKAIGKGMLVEPMAINVIEKMIRYQEQSYYLHNIPIKAGYILSVASDLPDQEITLVNRSF